MSVRVMSLVWANSRHKGSERLLLLAIADEANDFGCNAYPSIARLAMKTKLSERTIQRLVTSMTRGAESELSVSRGVGLHGVNHYYINLVGLRGEGVRNLQGIPPVGATSCHPDKLSGGDIQDREGVTSKVKRGDTVMSPNPVPDPGLDPVRSSSGAHNGKPQPKNNKLSEVIDRVRALGVEPVVNGGRDGRAVKECSAGAPDIAAAYAAVVTEEWGDKWLRANLSIHTVCDRMSGWMARSPCYSDPDRTDYAAAARAIEEHTHRELAALTAARSNGASALPRSPMF